MYQRSMWLARCALLGAVILSGGSTHSDDGTHTAQTYAKLAALAARQPAGPSYDCSLANLTSVERRICESGNLSKADLDLNEAFVEAAFDSLHSLTVVADQGRWLSERNRCATLACLHSSYAERIEALGNDKRDYENRWIREADARHRWRVSLTPRVVTRLKRLAGGKCFGIDGAFDVGDGRRSIFAHTCDGCPPVDTAFIFHPEGDGYRLIWSAKTCYVSGIFEGFQDERSHGLRRIKTFSRSGAADHFEDFYDYDGERYRCIARIEVLGVAEKHEWLIVTRP